MRANGVDRRQAGVQTAQFEDGNGRRVDVYSINVKKAHAVLAMIGTLLTMAVMVYGAVTVGVQHAVEVEIERQLATPTSALNRHLIATFSDTCALRQREVDRQLRGVSEHLAAVAATQLQLQAQVGELRGDVKVLIQRSD